MHKEALGSTHKSGLILHIPKVKELFKVLVNGDCSILKQIHKANSYPGLTGLEARVIF